MKRKLFYGGGVLLVLAIAVGAYFYFKPTTSETSHFLGPEQKTVLIAGDEFGPYETELFAEEGIASVYYERRTSEWYYLNFYLPAYWPDEGFTAFDVADYLRASMKSIIVNSFTAPDPVAGSDAYYLVIINEDVASSSAELFLAKISQVGPTPYSSFYGRSFTGENPRDMALNWIASHSEKYFGEIDDITPTASWLELFR